MDPYHLAFMLFIVINSFFSFKAGEKAGKFIGMISITQFFKEKHVLKDKNKIEGFKDWPASVQIMYVTPDPDLFD
mgnify:FL=1